MKKRKSFIACIVLVTFLFSIVTPCFAADNILVEEGQFIENNILYEYTIRTDYTNKIYTEVYRISNGERLLRDNFVTQKIGNTIYLDGKAVAYITAQDSETIYNGNVENRSLTDDEVRYYYFDNISSLSSVFTRGAAAVASVIAAALRPGNSTHFKASLFIFIAGEVIANSLDQIHYEQYIIYEPFPEDDPAVTLRERNKVAFYTNNQKTNMIGDEWIETIHETGWNSK